MASHVASRCCTALRLAAMGLAFGAASAPLSPSHAVEPIRPELSTSLEPRVELEAGWRQPPPESRVRCWWWWLNGNVTKAAITRDLEAMHAQGLGGANIIDAGGAEQRDNRQVPHGPDFGSPEWRELFLHALREADRLGLELGFNIQSGWNLGGPTVEPEDAAKKLTFAATDVEGGALVERRLRRGRTVGDFYRDIAVFALPLPDGEDDEQPELARLDGWRSKAYYEYPGAFTASDASHLMDVSPLEIGETPVAADAVVDLTSMVDNDGRLAWQAPAGRCRIVRIGYTLAGSRVSTHSEGWDGWAIDYLEPTAFDAYWQAVVAPMLKEAGPLVGRSLKYLHTDSWELGPVNWTPALMDEFQRRRGYDMRPYLPALAGYVVSDVETTTRFLNDFRRTLGDLIAAGKYATFSRYAHERGLAIHPESGGPHAAPVDAILCLGLSDIPMGEFWARSPTHRVHDFERFFTKQPASAAHVYGRRLVMAEAFTTIGPHWEEDPQSLKPVFDQAACEGLNVVMLHTFDCSPDSMGVPGQAYFAGTHINPHITWWRHSHAFFAYLNRCQFLLQQGLPAADVLYFYGENVPSFVRLKRDDPAGVSPQFEYDVINAEALIERTRVENGQIVLPDGTAYAALVLPPPNTYGLAALEHIAELVDSGARVIGPKPTRPIGLSATPADADRFCALADRLWSDDGGGGTTTVVAKPASEALADAGIEPDFLCWSDLGPDVDYIHRRTSEGDVYFVVNRVDDEVAFKASFRIVGRQPELWDPVTGETVDAAAFEQSNGRTIVPLALPPGGSVFVVFLRAIETDARGEGVDNQPRLLHIVYVQGPWTVHFDPQWGGPADVEFARLVDWTERPEDGIRHYSGTAVYRREFELPSDVATGDGAPRMYLDLGRVENVAAVTLNGQSLGVAWTEPFRVEITNAVRPGRNELAIEVTNLWPNRLIGDRRLPRSERRTRTNVTKFRADTPLLPSGLLGPVQILQR